MLYNIQGQKQKIPHNLNNTKIKNIVHTEILK